MTVRAVTPLGEPSPGPLEPVEIRLVQEHPFKKRKPTEDPKTGRMVKRIGCETCGRGKLNAAHLGAPPSLNEGGSGMDRMAYQSLKKAWMEKLTDALNASGLPRGLNGVSVEAQVGFPDVRSRDQGNHRWMIEKALGDALVAGGWLTDDSFYPVMRYEFGGLRGVHTPRESSIRLMLFPS